jgi:hypothetical protein
VPPLHRLPLGRFADSSPSSSRRPTTSTVSTTSVIFDASTAVHAFTFSTLTCQLCCWLFSSCSRPGPFEPSRTAWFDACFCQPTSRGLPSSASVASKSRSFASSFTSHLSDTTSSDLRVDIGSTAGGTIQEPNFRGAHSPEGHCLGRDAAAGARRGSVQRVRSALERSRFERNSTHDFIRGSRRADRLELRRGSCDRQLVTAIAPELSMCRCRRRIVNARTTPNWSRRNLRHYVFRFNPPERRKRTTRAPDPCFDPLPLSSRAEPLF